MPGNPLQIRLVSPESAAPTAFARILFGRAPTRPHDFRLPLRQLGGPARAELWTCPGPYSFTETGGLQVASSPDHCLVHACIPEEGRDLRRLSRELYDALLGAARERDYPTIVKAWNYLPQINAGSGDTERYKQFCLGRGDVYDERLPPGSRAPSATAIGTAPGEPLTVMLLAARHRVQTLENPRQVSAYRYPRRYGPRSPNFSRAALVHAAGGSQLFLSGTASIVGHESRHAGDVLAQLDETLANLDSLFDRVAAQEEIDARPSMGANCQLRIYVRHAEDALAVRRRLDRRLASPSDLVILHGDICRRELTVEVDGVIDRLVSTPGLAQPLTGNA